MEFGKIFDDNNSKAVNNSPLPEGWYNAIMEKVELKKTKAGTGTYLSIQARITGPSHAGAVVFGTITISNPNQAAEEVGAQAVGQIRAALGLAVFRNTEQIQGKSICVKVATEQSQGYDPRSTIKGYKAIEGSKAPIPTPPQAPTQATGGKTPPWAAKKHTAEEVEI